MNKRYKGLTALLICMILLFNFAIAEETLEQPDGQIKIAVVCTLEEEWEGWGDKSNYRSLLEPWLYTMLTPFMAQQNAVVTHYSLGLEDDGIFKDNASKKLENEEIIEPKDIEKVCDYVLSTQHIENYSNAYAAVLETILGNVQAEDRLEVWFIIDAAKLCPDENATADIRKQLLTLVEAPNVHLRLLCIVGNDAAGDMAGLELAKQIVLNATEEQQNRISVYSYEINGANDLLAPVRDGCEAQLQIINGIAWNENEKGTLEGALTVTEPARYMFTIPGYMQELSFEHTTTAGEKIATDSEVDTVVGDGETPETDVTTDKNETSADGEGASEENNIEDTDSLPSEPELPLFSIVGSEYGSWAMSDSPIPCGEYKIIIQYTGTESADAVKTYVQVNRQPMQIYWNDQLLQSSKGEETTFLINRADNTMQIVPPVISHEEIAWNVAVVMDGKVADTFECKQESDGSLSLSPVLANLFTQADMQIILYTDQPHAIYEFGPIVHTTVENRLPVTQSLETTQYAYFHFPQEAAIEEKPLNIELSSLFVDSDGDRLVYFIKDADDIWKNSVETESNLCLIKDNALQYQPLCDNAIVTVSVGAQDEVAVRRATAKGYQVDPAQLQTVETTITVQQVDVQNLHDELNLQLPADGTGEYELYGVPYKPVDFCLSFEDSEQLEHLARAYGYSSRYDENFISSFMLKAECTSIQDADAQQDGNADEIIDTSVSQTFELTSEVAVADGAMEWRLQLPASTFAVTHHVTYQLYFRDMPLPAASGQLTARIDNTAPVLVAEPVTSISCEIDGIPNKRKTINLSTALKEQESDAVSLLTAIDGNGIDVSVLFDERETKELLTYHIWLECDDECAQLVDSNLQPLVLQPEGYYLLDSANNSTVFDVQLSEVGLCKIRVEAFDGELTSNQNWELQLEVTSKVTRLLITAGIISAAILLLVCFILLIIHICKPRFHESSVSIDVEGALQNDNAMFLDAYGKKSVSILSAILSMQLPPIEGFDYKDLRNVNIKPSKKHGSVLEIGRNAQKNLQFVGNNGKTAAITEEGVLLATKNKPENAIRVRK